MTEFYKANKGTSFFPECKACNRERSRVWQRERRASDPTYSRRTALKSLYGITPEQYDERLAAQGGGCAICGVTAAGGRGRFFHVDHCHDSNAVRGLLCHGCNTGIGNLGDSPERLRKALTYLEGAVAF